MAQHKHEDQLQMLSQNEQQSDENLQHTKILHLKSKRHVQTAKMVAVIIICFVAHVGPLTIYMGLVALGAFVSGGISGFHGAGKDLFYTIGMILAMANSAVNPLIYYLKHPEFREKLKKIVSHKKFLNEGGQAGD